MNRYCFFLHAFYGGGAEKVLVKLANRLAERGEAVDIVVGQSEGPVKQFVSSKVRIVDLNRSRTFKAIMPLARYLRTEQPTALLTSVIHANIAASIAHWLARSPARLLLREANPEHNATQNIPAHKARILKFMARWAYRRADVVVSVSRTLETTIRKDLDIDRPDAIAVIYNPLEADFAALSSAPLTLSLRGNPEFPLVVGVGRLVEAKGFRVLIRALSLIRNTHPTRLVIAGQGEDLPVLQAMVKELGIEDQVTFPGYIANPLPLMKEASLYVLSSYLEGLPNTLVEAVACGTPVVATDCPTGPREVLDHGRIGALVPVGDAEAMAAAIKRALGGNIPEFDRQAWMQQFEIDSIVDQYLAVMNPTVQGRP